MNMIRKYGVLGVMMVMPSMVWANPFDLFGAGARAQAMNGAVAAVTDDYMATYHNPAGLAGAKNSIGFGVGGSFNRTSIRLSPRPSGYDPPAYALRLKPRADTENPSGVAGFTFGGSLGLFSDDLTLGVLIFAPTQGFAATNSGFPDEREQYFSHQLRFELLGDRADSEVIAIGMGYQLLPWLSMGVGMLLLPDSQTITSVYTPNPTDPSQVDLNLHTEQSTRRALTLGVMVEPLDWLKIGITFQDEIYLGINGYNTVQLKGEEAQDPPQQKIEIVQHFSPPRISLSTAFIFKNGLLTTLEGTWHGWSRYLDDHGRLAGFKDTIDWKLGIEYTLTKSTWVRGGLGWFPTPVPDQTGRTNFVDNDRFSLSGGAGRDFEIWGQNVSLAVGVQVHGLIARSVEKSAQIAAECTEDEQQLCDEVSDLVEDTPLVRAADTEGLQTGNPGFPGFAHGGYVIAAGVDFKWHF